MLDKIKEVMFYGTSDFPNNDDNCDDNDSFLLYSSEFFIRTKYGAHLGCFQTEYIYDYALYNVGDDFKVNINDIIGKYKVIFLCSESMTEIQLKDILYFKSVDELTSISYEIINDIEQPERAIANYLIRESQQTKYSQKEFYQMVIDSAQHELELVQDV